MKKNSLISLFWLLSMAAFGQYGNEWIDENQEYYKIKVVEDGFYRVTATELEAQGFPTNSVPSSRIQLFRRGEEVAIRVNSTGGVLNYLEFYGERNKGEGDADLYLQPGHQPHQEYNLFTDTATYFLTWKLTAENGLRMGLSTLNDPSGLTPDSYHLNDPTTLKTSDYASGIKFGSGSSFTLSDYDNGEGWTGPFRSKGSSETFTFTLDNLTTGADPSVEVVLIGGNTLNHNVDILAGPNTGSLRNIGNVQFSNRGTITQSFSFLNSDVNADGTFVVRVNTTGFDGAADRVSTALVRVTYPEELTMSASENKEFHLRTIGTSERAYVRIFTTNAAGTDIYEISNPKRPVRISTTNFSDRLECIIPGPETDRSILAVTGFQSIVKIQPAEFNFIEDLDFTIITHPALRENASDGLDPIQAYADYRSSVEGGGLTTQIFTTFEAFDLFNYGAASPIAIQRLADWLHDNGSPQALFLIGKGRTSDENFYRNTSHTVVNVPTYGSPGGDLPFVRGLGSNPLTPDLAIGRLNAFTPEDVKAYLDKVKEHEARPYDQLNRKNILQLSGGQSAQELAQFNFFIRDFESQLESDFLGGRAINFSKQTSNAVEVIDVVKEVNDGLGMITFFGHSSGTVTDIEIGRVSDPQFGFSNQGQYPIILVNGCNAGDIFGSNFTFGEDWMHTPDLGAIAVMANADFASSTSLKRWSDLFHEVAFTTEESFGNPIGEVIREVSQAYYDRFGTSNLSQTQVLQALLQGDPMVRVFGAAAPDYEITNESLSVKSFDNGPLFAVQDSFKLDLAIKNYGRTVTDSLLVQVRRTLPQGDIQETYMNILRPLYQDSVTITIYNEPGQMTVGTNLIEVFLDPGNETAELNEGNNYAQLEVQIFQGNTAHLYPMNYAVLNSETIRFVWQPTDISEPDRAYDLEIDSVKTFDSGLNQIFSESGTQLLEREIDLSPFNLPDSTTIFWRTRFADPQNSEEEEWQMTSFTLIENAPSGWGQFTVGQIDEGQIQGVEYNSSSKSWEFITTDAPIDVVTYGADFPGFDYDDLSVLANGIDYLVTSNTIDPECRQNTINALVFDNESTNPYRPIEINGADVFNDLVCGRLPQMVYNLTQSDVLGANARLEQLVGNMSTGDHILLFNIGQVNFSAWDQDVLDALELVGIGSSLISGLTDGQPIIILGRKGDAPGSANAVLNDGSATPPREQMIRLIGNVQGSFTSGTITTSAVGPAKNWNALEYIIKENPEDNVTVFVVGVKNDGTEENIFAASRLTDLDLSTVDVNTYPRLKLQFAFSDETNLTPPELDFWQIDFELPPEGILLSEVEETIVLQEGQDAMKNFAFYNYSDLDFTDSLTVTSTLRNTAGITKSSEIKIAAPIAGDSTVFETDVPTSGLDGLTNQFTSVVAAENELYDFNNQLNLSEIFEVQADRTNPILDVTFDGKYIVNGDIVSPEPNIVIRLKDDNSFLKKTDTVGLDIQLKRPCEGCDFERIHFSDPSINFMGASETADLEVSYTPEALEDGIYSLSAQARDQSGNSAGEEPYLVEFEVISESSITHFYPYPNPFSTQTRFVFTLTGDQIPEKLKIQIMTISGRVVKEINQNEIGPIQIGHNMTEYAWDGTDEFGDQLANGVYFYRVLMESGGQPIEHRSTSADGAFKNGFGKLYILR